MINLAKFSESSIVLSGRPKGEKIRSNLQLEKQDSLPESVDVLVPEKIISINSSFFLGLFGPSIRKLGKDGFKRKYIFSTNAAVMEDVERGIRDALNSSNPFGS